MVSRYEAFVREDWKYISETSTCQELSDLVDIPKTEWLKLEVIKAYDNFVEFKAYYKDANEIKLLHEKSEFIQVHGMWKYKEGIIFNSKIQRNENCPCGSGKKFKKCCG